MAPADSSCVEIRACEEQRISKRLIVSTYRSRYTPEIGLLTPELTELGLVIALERSFNHLFQWKRTP